MRGLMKSPEFGRTGVTWLLAASAFWLSACGRVHGTNSASSAPMQQITLHVPGMIDRQGIT
jgi:hypothetical protein